MSVEQNMMQTIMQVTIEAAKAAIMAVREARSRQCSKCFQISKVMPRKGGLVLKQPTFNLKAT